MKKRKISSEQLSAIYDTVRSDNSDIKKLYPHISKESLEDFYLIEKTISIVRSMKELQIKDPDHFCSNTLQRCRGKKHFRYSLVNRVALPAAAAVIVVAGGLSFNAYNEAPEKGNKDINIASEVDSNKSYVIEVDDEKNVHEITDAIIDHGGAVVNESADSITAKAKISSYIAIKKDLTISEEDKLFFKISRNLMLADTNSNVYTSDYVDQTITFEITVAE